MADANRPALKQLWFTVQGAKYPSLSNIIYISSASVLFGIFVIVFFNKTEVLGLIFILLGLVLLYVWLKPYFYDKKLFESRPPDALMDEWLIEELHTIVKPLAIGELRIDESKLSPENFLIIPYPVFWEAPGLDPASMSRRQGGDGAFRYTTWKVQVVALTENYISIFFCMFNTMTGAVSGINSSEYFYDDIAAVSSENKSLDYKILGEDEEQTVGAVPIVKLHNLSGNHLEIITGVSVLGVSGATAVDSSTVVKAIRIMLRNRRYNEEIIIEKEETAEDAPTDDSENEASDQD